MRRWRFSRNLGQRISLFGLWLHRQLHPLEYLTWHFSSLLNREEMLSLFSTGQGEVSVKVMLLSVRKAKTSSTAVIGLYAKRLI